MPWTKDYEDFQRDNQRDDGPSAEDYHEYEDLDLTYLDTPVDEDGWHRTFVVTGSISTDPDWS